MKKLVDTNSDNPRQPGMIQPDPDNADPWTAGYAAGLRASGSTFVDDDHVDPRVVIVRMLPGEYLDEAVARPQLIELKRRLASLDRRMARLEDQSTAPAPMVNDAASPPRRPQGDWRG
ncbi:MAG TPA: hypothetical protein VFE60_03535 [Roseiarcus sp.]|jgi:hypothetical protein|nr:hypothetical protein [Roseiarcus sp.]